MARAARWRVRFAHAVAFGLVLCSLGAAFAWLAWYEPQLSLPAVVAEVDAAPAVRPNTRLIRPRSTARLVERFEAAGYGADALAGPEPPPPFIVVRLPEDWAEDLEVDERKSLFLRAILPLVLQANAETAAERARLLQLRGKTTLTTRERRWLDRLAARYRVQPSETVNWDALVQRVDIVPPSLALAQAALESGWGRSRFALQGNALYGEWTWLEGGGIVPAARKAGKTHSIRRFDTLLGSVRSYLHNLNTSLAYQGLRQRRAALRAAGRTPMGSDLARLLGRYSEEGEAYVEKVRRLIRVNGLAEVDALTVTVALDDDEGSV